MSAVRPFVVGIAGWKNSGKTTLVTRLVAALVARGYAVSTVKYSHHDVAFEAEDTDSARHRRAGAYEVAVVSPTRWAILHELREAPEPALDEVIARLSPADIVLVEGYKRASIPKIEVRRRGQAAGPQLASDDPSVIALASDEERRAPGVPAFALDDVEGLVDLVLQTAGFAARKEDL